MSDVHYLVECHPLMRVTTTAAVGVQLEPGDWVVLRFKGCEDVGIVRSLTDDLQAKAIVIRKADTADMIMLEEARPWERQTLELFCKMIKESGLPMKVVDVHAWADRRKIAFYFLAEHRLDFRKLHKEVSTILDTRVVIKQIGIRDHAKLIGGLGPCGRELCCTRFLSELRPISLRTARRQNLYVNPEKISGMCGRLLCCLRFEDEAYLEQFLLDTGSREGALTPYEYEEEDPPEIDETAD